MNKLNSLSKLDVYQCPLDGINLIEASAGTGKTWTICALYLRLLLEQQRTVDQILVVTFTNAAAAELRDRVRQRLVDMLAYLNRTDNASTETFFVQLHHSLHTRLSLTDELMCHTLELALNAFDEAAIFTIHGYCQRALGDAPFSACRPLSMEPLLDDTQWLAQVVNDFWRCRVAGGELDDLLVVHLKQCKDSPELYAKVLHQHLQRPAATVQWPEDIDEEYTVDVDEIARLLSRLRALWLTQRDAIVELVGTTGFSKTYYKPDYIEEAASEWDELLACNSVQECLQCTQKRRGLLAQASIENTKHHTKQTKSVPQHEFFADAQQLLELLDVTERQLALARLRLLRDLIKDGRDALIRLKREERVIAFNDMLANLHDQLYGADGATLAGKLGQRFPVALVDEFQDTDPLQFAIFKAIYVDPQRPFFIVGDPKQAIYSFRNADLHTYLSARECATNCYTIAENQRSTKPLIDALNGLFSRNSQIFMLDGLDYPAAEVGANRPVELVDTSGSLPGALQVWALPNGPGTGGLLLNGEAQLASVRACANEIARLLNSSFKGDVKLGDEPLKAGDMAVLVRSHAHGTMIRRALIKLGIGCVQRTHEGVYASSEAEELERVLLAISSPTQERLVRAALATEAMGMNAVALEALGRDGEDELQHVIQRFLEYRDIWFAAGVAVMLRRWFSKEKITSRLLSHVDGERRLTNFLHLFELLHEAQREHPAPEALMAWFQVRRQDPREDQTAQLRLESDENLVQIVTVHTAKGLEYPIVFCPLLWTKSKADGDGEVAAYYVDEQGRAVFDYRKVFAEEFSEIQNTQNIGLLIERENAAESLRLIYVALTRAKQRCVLVAGSHLFGQYKKPTVSSRALLNWLVAGDGYTPEDWFKNTLEPEDIRAAWQSFAAENSDSVSLAPLPLHNKALSGITIDALKQALSGGQTEVQTLPVTPPVTRGWRFGSYSSIAHGAKHERATADHDLRAIPVTADSPLSSDAATASSAASPTPLEKSSTSDSAMMDAPVGATDILNFPRGAGAGDALHGIFENIDFTTPDQWPEVIDTRLRGFHDSHSMRYNGVAGSSVASAEHVMDQRQMQKSQVLSMLGDVLNTPLPVGTTTPLFLNRLASQKRLNELEFYIPVERLTAGSLNRVLHTGGYETLSLSFYDLQGYFKGFIDLVLEHEGRYFVLDWKSNHLGDSAQHYACEPLARVMQDNNYRLQSLVYSMALQRFLKQRLPDYNYEQHFGGAIYLFIRGVRPAWTVEQGLPAGVVFDRPSEQLLTMIDGLFAQSTEPLPA